MTSYPTQCCGTFGLISTHSPVAAPPWTAADSPRVAESLARTARDLPTWVVGAVDAPDADVARLEALGVRVSRSPDLGAALGELRRAGVDSLLVEGGGALGGLLLAQGLVDRLYWIQAPIWLGNDGVAAFPGVAGGPLAAAPRWIPVERRELGADTLLVLDRSLCLPAS